MKRNLWRGRIGFGALVALGLVSVLIAVVAMTKMEFIPRKPLYRSEAKLVAGGRMTANTDFRWEEMQQDFYGTIIETLESTEMRKRAMERVKTLHPGLKTEEATVQVVQTKGSAIFKVQCTSGEPKFAQIFLNSMLDEFIAFRQTIREQAQGKVLSTFLQEVVNKQKVMEARNAALAKYAGDNNIIGITNGSSESFYPLVELKSRREQLRERKSVIKVALQDLPSWISVSHGEKDAWNQERSEMENIYLQTEAEILVLKNNRSFLLKSVDKNHPEVTAIDTKLAKASDLAGTAIERVKSEYEAQLVILEKLLVELEKTIGRQEQELLEKGALIAEHAKLKNEAELAQTAYREMFQRAENYVGMFNIQSDYVAIQERASPAEKVIASSLIPVWKLWSGSAEPEVKEAK